VPAVVGAVTWAVVCGMSCDDAAGGATPAPDGGGSSDAGPGTPTRTARARLTPCPSGWTELVTPDGTAYCDAWGGGEPEECELGEARFPGEEACAPVGTPCDDMDEFAADLPADASIVYVRPGGGLGADGSRAFPFHRITDALAAAPSGGVIALARGTYAELLAIRRPDVTLWGACAAGTILTSSTSSEAGAIVGVAESGVVIKNLSVAGAERPGIVVTGAGDELTLEGVAVERVRTAGITAIDHAHLVASRIVVRDIAAQLSTLRFGFGVLVQTGATAELDGLSIQRAHLAGLQVNGGDETTVVHVTDVVLRDSLSDETGTGRGFGIEVLRGGQVTLVRADVRHNRSAGIVCQDPGSRVDAIDTTFRDTLPDEVNASTTLNVLVQGGCAGSLTRVLSSASAVLGVGAFDGTSTFTVSDLLVAPTRADVATTDWGMVLARGVGATIERLTLEASHEIGLLVTDPGTHVTASDVTVAHTEGAGFASGTGFGTGLAVQDGASLTLHGALLDRTRLLGLAALGAGTVLDADAVDVIDTLPASCEESFCAGASGGHGVVVAVGAHAHVRDFTVRRSAVCGAFLGEGSELDLSEGEVSGCAIGACIQADGFDFARLSDRVAYHDNGATFDSTHLPVPGALDTPVPPAD